ncbi:NAD(P)H-binding protein [Iamia sp. SCSIO 61187]|uniref:NAD(P)H-binding protein n=1 Tax=Iamia sp. SCSIO 61187 TaxID=2722752 RepID=UPI001C62B82E|nr:NAD(P)H-binding protein [Iamia sp. SCSIO 61187]QYG92356.1 NAD(P)H-binding protein [Iamia sp. SCSIO 61187]
MTEERSRSVHVTGGSGFLGGFVIPLLVEGGYEVSALARTDAAADRLQTLGANPIEGDLDSASSIRDAFSSSRASNLVNLASLGFGHAAPIVAAAEEAGLHRALFVSTTAIFTRLNAPSKAVRTEAERTIRASNLQWTIIRPTMIYGTPGDRNMWRLLRLVSRVPVVPMPGGGHNLQQPVHVADLADAIVVALGTDRAIDRAYDVGGPEPISFRRILDDTGDAVGRSVKGIPIPHQPIVRFLTAVERRGKPLPLKAEQIERLVEDKAFDISAARADLGYSPRSFAAGIAAESRMHAT